MHAPVWGFVAQTASVLRYLSSFPSFEAPPPPPDLGWAVLPEAAWDHVTSYGQGGYWDRNAAGNPDWVSFKIKRLSFHALFLSEG